MKFLVLLVGIVLLGAALAVFLFPGVLVDVLSVVDRRRNHYLIALSRVTMGSILAVGAHTTAWPVVIRWIGYFLIAAGIALLLVPQPYTQRIARWWGGKTMAVVRLWMLLPLTLAGVIVASTLVGGS